MRVPNGMVLIGIVGSILSVEAYAEIVSDTYIGLDDRIGNVAPYKDVLGTPTAVIVNEVKSADVARIGNDLVVKINTSFWDGFHNYQYGDLFISTHGYVAPPDSNFDDGSSLNAGPGKKWDFVFDTSAESLYQIDQDFVPLLSRVRNNPTFSNANPSAADPTQGTHWVQRESGGLLVAELKGAFEGNPLAAGAEQPSTGTFIRYTIPLSALELTVDGQFDLGIRWTQTCANDIIEGAVHIVPEPETYTCLAAGLLALGWLARRRQDARAWSGCCDEDIVSSSV